jgi:hypothetical protein
MVAASKESGSKRDRPVASDDAASLPLRELEAELPGAAGHVQDTG